MSYRNIIVNNKTYQYTIGRTFVKIKGFGIFSKEQYGTKLDNKFIITPKNIENIILGKSRPMLHCKLHNVTTDKMVINPFYAEIYNKKVLMIDCPQCVGHARDNI